MAMTRRRDRWRDLVHAMRTHHWSKNFLVFVPMLAAHRYTDPVAWLQAAIVFSAFCLCASAMYVFNDWIDRDADRAHPEKSRRAIASGRVGGPIAITAMATLAPLGLLIAGLAGGMAAAIAAGYVSLAAMYTLSLKHYRYLDVAALVVLYLARVAAGSVATGVDPSAWLAVFAACALAAVALGKRLGELAVFAARDRVGRVTGRPYDSSDFKSVSRLALLAGALGAATLLLYPLSASASSYYARPWILCGLAAAWSAGFARMFLRASRGRMHHDPVVFAFTDTISLAAVVLSIALLALAR